MTHICVGKLTIIVSDNGLSPERHQAIIWTNDGIFLIRTLGKKLQWILSEMHSFSFKKMHLKMSSAKWRLFHLGLNELMERKRNLIASALALRHFCTKPLTGCLCLYTFRTNEQTIHPPKKLYEPYALYCIYLYLVSYDYLCKIWATCAWIIFWTEEIATYIFHGKRSISVDTIITGYTQ